MHGLARQAQAAAERLGDGIADLIAATIEPPAAGVDRGALLAAVAQPREERPRRPRVSTRAAVTVFRRDSWICRYCGIKTIAPPVLRFLFEIYPKEFPYHPNWRSGELHDSWLVLSTSLDHVVPGARGGNWTASENLATACWACNSAKADLLLEEVGWHLLTEDDMRSDWDGLTDTVEALWALAGSSEALFKTWRPALSAQASGPTVTYDACGPEPALPQGRHRRPISSPSHRRASLAHGSWGAECWSGSQFPGRAWRSSQLGDE